MRRKRASVISLGVVFLAFGACDGRDDSLTGNWTGAFRDSIGGLGGGNLTFNEQSGPTVQGSWQFFFMTFGSAKQFHNGGSLTGTVDGNSITVMLSPLTGCSLALQATRSGLHMSGTYAAVSCAVSETGSFDLEKE
jgi:hypothetical protein